MAGFNQKFSGKMGTDSTLLYGVPVGYLNTSQSYLSFDQFIQPSSSYGLVNGFLQVWSTLQVIVGYE